MTIDYDELEPFEAIVVTTAEPNKLLTFQVKPALPTLTKERVNFYYFINYDNNDPNPPDSFEDPFEIELCDDRIGMVTSVEVLVSEGELLFDFSTDGDKRVMRNGEDVKHVRWTIHVVDDQKCTQ